MIYIILICSAYSATDNDKTNLSLAATPLASRASILEKGESEKKKY